MRSLAQSWGARCDEAETVAEAWSWLKNPPGGDFSEFGGRGKMLGCGACGLANAGFGCGGLWQESAIDAGSWLINRHDYFAGTAES